MRTMNGYTWHTYHGDARGSKIEGDATAWSTQWWNAWFIQRLWKKLVVFRPQTLPNTPYRIGFRTHDGRSFVMDRMITDAQFAMRVGHEDCTFFALSKTDGLEIPLRVVAHTNKDDPKHQDTPLY
ncbi:hypothetical protein HY634_01160 [Candidatus Uhrbacteria bacterium]|nr:hypothetical protein [Candidatus Uhrbacteria bacterium]